MNNRLITALIAIVFLAMPWNNKLLAQEDSISMKFPSRYPTIIFHKKGEMASDTLISKGSFHFFDRNLKNIDPDSLKNITFLRIESEGSNRDRRFFYHNHTPFRQATPGNFHRFTPRSGEALQYNFRRAPLKQKSDVIDLTDQGIITYKKKKLSGGREKIIVIRKEVQELKVEEGKESPQYLPYRDLKEGDELREMNAPRIYREHNLRRKDMPAPSEVPTPAEKK